MVRDWKRNPVLYLGKAAEAMDLLRKRTYAPADVRLKAVIGRWKASAGGLPAGRTIPARGANRDGSVWPGQDAGLLGRVADPWLLNVNPTTEGNRVSEISLPAYLSPERISGRKDLLEHLQRGLDLFDQNQTANALDAQSRQALDLLRSPQSRQAFLIEEEPEHVRERYGQAPIGQNALLARRMGEAGVRLVQVNG